MKTKINLKNKSKQYIKMLHQCIEKYRKADPERLKLFLKYADPDTGVVTGKMGLLHILTKAEQKFILMVQPGSFAIAMLINGPSDLIGNSAYETVREINVKQAYNILGKIDTLLWVRRRPWYTTLEKVRFVDLARELIYLQRLDAKLSTGYCFDDLPTNYMVG